MKIGDGVMDRKMMGEMVGHGDLRINGDEMMVVPVVVGENFLLGRKW